MKRVVMVLSALVLIGQGVVWAGDCPPGTTLQVIGTVSTAGQADTIVSAAGHLVRAVRQSCGATACVATMYDTASNGAVNPRGTGAVDNTVVDEPGAPANESRWYPYDPPLNFVNGIFVHNNGAAQANATLAYECK